MILNDELPLDERVGETEGDVTAVEELVYEGQRSCMYCRSSSCSFCSRRYFCIAKLMLWPAAESADSIPISSSAKYILTL